MKLSYLPTYPNTQLGGGGLHWLSQHDLIPGFSDLSSKLPTLTLALNTADHITQKTRNSRACLIEDGTDRLA